MPISMSPKARYVTQGHIYETQILGPLTDRRIAKYNKSSSPKPKTREKRLKKLLAMYE